MDLQPQNAQPASYLEWLEHHTPDHPHAAPLVAQLASPDSAYRSPSARENLSNQAVVAEVWNSVLKLKQADLNTDFFATGGGYPAAVQLVDELSVRLDRPIDVSDLYFYPTVTKLSEWLEGSEGEEEDGRGSSEDSSTSSSASSEEADAEGALRSIAAGSEPDVEGVLLSSSLLSEALRSTSATPSSSMLSQLAELEKQLEVLLGSEATVEVVKKIEELQSQLDLMAA